MEASPLRRRQGGLLQSLELRPLLVEAAGQGVAARRRQEKWPRRHWRGRRSQTPTSPAKERKVMCL